MRRPITMPESVLKALGGEQDNLLVAALDITSADAAQVAVGAAVARFGRIDVLIDNAATFQEGYFEEISEAQMRAQIETKRPLWAASRTRPPQGERPAGSAQGGRPGL
ncbi:SDR family NAD(P)-dependent oxidoreductase [Streptomyces mirabilis]|uniref:SDR family NAD(P)-dependent oxidoreductase n=1 Tax=Streptomyces mirabilis TaxID=68239 RepID=UPI003D9F9830